jgi:DeoR/GlpR family transcriptional regulator of sugar metabolism
MLTSERKRLILDCLRRDGRVVAKPLAAELGLSEDTIRRDLREMARDKLLARVHGGALPIAPELPDFTTRKSVATDEKDRLAARAAALIEPGMTVFLDGGTTNESLARHLPKNAGLTVVTHSPTIASVLEPRADLDIWLIGGRIYRHSMVAVGAAAAEAIGRLRPDIFFMGVTAVHGHHGFSTGDAEEAAIKRLISRQSRQTWVIATLHKLDAASPCTIVPLGEVTGLVLPEGAMPEQKAQLASAGLQMIEA